MSEKIIQLNEDGFHEVLGAAEGMKEDKASWVSFFQWLRGRGLDGVKLIVGDKCMGMPLRYNYDKPEKPRISRVFGYLARFFILFQTEKSSREVVIS